MATLPTIASPAARAAAAAAALLTAACASTPPVPPVPPQTFEDRLAQIFRLEDERVLRDPPPPPVVAVDGRTAPAPPPPPNLLVMLGDPQARLRRRAALAIGRVGLPEGVAPLVKALGDPVPEVREMASFALGLLRHPDAVVPLRERLEDESLMVQGRAAEALGLIADEASAAAIGKMVARTASDSWVRQIPADHDGSVEPVAEAFRLGVGALVRLKAYEPLAAAVLDAGGQPAVQWWPVAYGLERLADPRAAPALLTMARTETRLARGFAVKGLGSIKERQATPAILKLFELVETEPGLVAEGVRALAKIADASAGPVLVKYARDPRVGPGLRAEILGALAPLRSDEARDVILDFMTDRSPAVRAAAVRALAVQEPALLVTVLSGLDPDPHWSVRAALAGALGGVNPGVAVSHLQQMLDDPDQRVVPAVLTALAGLKAPGIETALLERLKAEDFAVRLAAARGLGELKPESGVSALAAAYEAGQRDASYVARGAALDALAAYGIDAARPTLTTALGDKDWAIRVRAAEHLARLVPDADLSAVRPAPTQLSRDDYRATPLVNPQYSPHAYLETAKGTIEIELAVLDAPLTVRNFVQLARRGFFNGLTFHRVVRNFVAQAGDPRGDGEGGPGYTIRDELNDRPYRRGTVGMALDWADTGGSQFFIAVSAQPHLEARYTVFGHVVAGLDVVDRLEPWDVIDRVLIWDGVELTASR